MLEEHGAESCWAGMHTLQSNYPAIILLIRGNFSLNNIKTCRNLVAFLPSSNNREQKSKCFVIFSIIWSFIYFQSLHGLVQTIYNYCVHCNKLSKPNLVCNTMQKKYVIFLPESRRMDGRVTGPGVVGNTLHSINFLRSKVFFNK